MNEISGILNKEPKLIGILNNSVREGGGSGGKSKLYEDILERQKWEKVDGQNKYVYKYHNDQLNSKFFIQIIPNVERSDYVELGKAGLYPNVIMDTDISKTTYNIYSINRPNINIKITILADSI